MGGRAARKLNGFSLAVEQAKKQATEVAWLKSCYRNLGSTVLLKGRLHFHAWAYAKHSLFRVRESHTHQRPLSTGVSFQISALYSAMVRSVENLPLAAELMMLMRTQRSRSR